MSKILSAATLATLFAARLPNAGGKLDSVSASADKLSSVNAMAIKNYAASSGKLQWVKITEHVLVAGEFAAAGDFVQVEEVESQRMIAAGRAELATDADVSAAQKKGK